jgi:hypothetical protein
VLGVLGEPGVDVHLAARGRGAVPLAEPSQEHNRVLGLFSGEAADAGCGVAPLYAGPQPGRTYQVTKGLVVLACSGSVMPARWPGSLRSQEQRCLSVAGGSVGGNTPPVRYTHCFPPKFGTFPRSKGSRPGDSGRARVSRTVPPALRLLICRTPGVHVRRDGPASSSPLPDTTGSSWNHAAPFRPVMSCTPLAAVRMRWVRFRPHWVIWQKSVVRGPGTLPPRPVGTLPRVTGPRMPLALPLKAWSA